MKLLTIMMLVGLAACGGGGGGSSSAGDVKPELTRVDLESNYFYRDIDANADGSDTRHTCGDAFSFNMREGTYGLVTMCTEDSILDIDENSSFIGMAQAGTFRDYETYSSLSVTVDSCDGIESRTRGENRNISLIEQADGTFTIVETGGNALLKYTVKGYFASNHSDSQFRWGCVRSNNQFEENTSVDDALYGVGL